MGWVPTIQTCPRRRSSRRRSCRLRSFRLHSSQDRSCLHSSQDRSCRRSSQPELPPYAASCRRSCRRNRSCRRSCRRNRSPRDQVACGDVCLEEAQYHHHQHHHHHSHHYHHYHHNHHHNHNPCSKRRYRLLERRSRRRGSPRCPGASRHCLGIGCKSHPTSPMRV